MKELKKCVWKLPSCKFVNNDNIFKLADQSPNDALFLNDEVHLNVKGTYKLIYNLGLSSMAKWEKNSRKLRKQTSRREHVTKNATDTTYNWKQHSDTINHWKHQTDCKALFVIS